jgi:hypothetical protein
MMIVEKIIPQHTLMAFVPEKMEDYTRLWDFMRKSGFLARR